MACYFAGFMGLDQLANLTNVGTLVAFAIICLTVIYLRFARPNLNRPFNMPVWVMLPIAGLGAILCFLLLKSLLNNPETASFFGKYMLGGAVIYFLYGMWFSRLGRGMAITGTTDQPNPTQP